MSKNSLAADVERKRDLLAELEAGEGDGLRDDLERLLIGGQVRGVAALVPHAGASSRSLRTFFSAWKSPRPAQRLGEGGAPNGTIMNSWTSTLVSAWAPPLRMFMMRDGSVRGVKPPTNGIMATRGPERPRGRGHGDAQDGIRAQLALRGRAVELDEARIDGCLIGRVHPQHGGSQLFVTLATALRTPFPP